MADEPRPARQMIKLLIADVDGTLVTNDKVLTERSVMAARALREHGVLFTVTSGRPPRGMAMLIEPLRLDAPIAGFNGGMFVEPTAALTVIEQHTIPDDLPADIIDAILEHGLDAWLYQGNDWYVRDRAGPHVAREEWTVKFAPRVVASFSDHLSAVAKIVGVSDDHGAVARCEQALQSRFGIRVSATRSQAYYVDVTHPDANKGGVAQRFSRRVGIPLENIATIGDQPNDVLMFARSGLSIAMGNASDAVKHQAAAVTDSNDADGFAKAVERFILSEQPAVPPGRESVE